MMVRYIKQSLVIFLLLLATGCDDDAKPHGDLPAPRVSLLEVKPHDVELQYEYPGRVAGIKVAQVQARVGGIILEKNYTEGGVVKVGDLLFKIDPKPFEVLLEQAKANIKSNEAQLALNKLNFDRSSALFKKNVITAQQYDAAVAAYKQSQASMQALKSNLETAQINLGYTNITAPISGITSQEVYSVGNLVGTNSTNTILTTITQLDPIYVNFAYPDSDIMTQRNLLMDNSQSIMDSLKVVLRFGDDAIYETEGSINFTNNVIDPNTGSISARAIFKNPDLKLIPGQFVRITLKGVIAKDVLVVPANAVIESAKGPMVYVVNDEKAEIRFISLGQRTNEGYIIKDGLKAGDKVVTSGMIKVRPGHKVMAINSGIAPQAADSA